MLIKKYLFPTLVVFLLLAGSSGFAWQSSLERTGVDEFTDHLDTNVPRLLDKYEIPGVSIALIRDGELVWAEAYGYADLDQKLEMHVDTVFRAESISKSVTAWGVLNLAEEGLIELDAPVQNYLEDWEFPSTDFDVETVTVRMLLSASSGLALGPIGADAEYAPGSPEVPSMREYLTSEIQFEQQPGEGFIYSNVGYNLLELLIEEVTGQSFETYMNEEVLVPIGMQHSSFIWSENDRITLATGYDMQGQPVEAYVYPASGAGGLTATAEDIALFMGAGMTGPYYDDYGVLSEDQIELLYTPQVKISSLFGVVAESYGLGHFLETLPDNQKAVWHGGQGHGWMTHFHAIPNTGNGIVIMTNSQRSWPLIAAVLKDWSGWLGFGLVDFSRIAFAQYAMWVLIGVMFAASIWEAIKVRRKDTTGKRRPNIGIKGNRYFKVLRMLISIGILGLLIWCVNQPYLMVSAIFPSSAKWLGLAFLIFAIINLLSAFLQQQNDI